MCELFGLSSNSPTALTELLQLFGERGGKSADNPDGWGLVFRENDSWRLYKDADAAANSEHYLNCIQGIQSNLAIAHVRKANPPTACVSENTHPFIRECCGQSWVFAHNGKIPEVTQPDGCCYPVVSKPLGETDSEHAFYYLLDEIANVFKEDEAINHLTWLRKLASLSEAIANYGQFNFLMSNGSYLIAYGHDRLHSLEYTADITQAECTIIVATEPLTNDIWQVFQAGEMRVYHGGRLIGDMITHPMLPTSQATKDDAMEAAPTKKKDKGTLSS